MYLPGKLRKEYSILYIIYGFDEPTGEIVRRAYVHSKVSDSWLSSWLFGWYDVWIEYHEPSRSWIVKYTSSRGKGEGCASVSASPPKASRRMRIEQLAHL